MEYVLIGLLVVGKAFVRAGVGLAIVIAIGNVISKIRRKWRT